jgi:NDP-sugar pyrophosphorylase family protein
MDSHISSSNIFTISSYKREQRSDYGVLEVGKQKKLVGFKEKPVVEYDVSMGIYVASKRILDYIPYNQSYGFDQLMLDLIDNNNPPQVIRHDGYWLDIGRPDDYAKACEDMDKILIGNE